MTEPLLGDYFVVRTKGLFGLLVRFFTRSTINHCGIYVGDGQIIEARPGGAGYRDVTEYQGAYWSCLPLTDEQRSLIASIARAVIGTPYNVWDILVIAFAQERMGRRIKPTTPIEEQPWLIRRVVSGKKIICSQLVADCYAMAGVVLFQEKRLSGLTAPADLYRLFAT